MEFNTTEMNSNYTPVESYDPKPTRLDALKAAMQNYTSVSLSEAKDKHYKSEMETNSAEWAATDPDNADLYKRVSKYDVRDVDKLEALYENGDTDSIKNFVQTNPWSMDVFMADDFLKMKALQKEKGFKDFQTINEDIKVKALDEFHTSAKTLEDSEYWGMEMLGTMAGAMQDIKTLQTLPLGTWKTGGSVAANATRAVFEEMGIESLAQIGIAPEVYAFKQEIGLKTSIAQEAMNAATAIGTAGLFRGVGSAAFDLSPLGRKALQAKDPGLSEDYENLIKSQATDDVKAHIDNLQKTEFGAGVEKIENPNELGQKLNEADPVPEFKEEFVASAETQKAQVIDDDLEMRVSSGTDEQGKQIYKSYKEINEEHDMTDAYLTKAKECFL